MQFDNIVEDASGPGVGRERLPASGSPALVAALGRHKACPYIYIARLPTHQYFVNLHRGPVAPETPRSLPLRGQGLVEYALIIALVAVLLFAALSAMHDHLSTVFSQVGGGL